MNGAQRSILLRMRRPEDDDGDLLAQIERTEEAGRIVEEFSAVAARLAALERQDQQPEENHG